jgi:hypothetical protein
MTLSSAQRLGYSEEHWATLSPADRALILKVKPLPRSASRGDHQLATLERSLDLFKDSCERMGGTFDLNPDFQRGHVWTEEQKVAYIENVLRGLAPLNFKFNAPHHSGRTEGGDLNPADIVCVDGLQRLTALREFLGDKFAVFGGVRVADLTGTEFDPRRMYCSFEIFELTTRRDLLQFYLDLNSGGTVHTPTELARVRQLRDTAPAPEPLVDAPQAVKRRRPSPGKGA